MGLFKYFNWVGGITLMFVILFMVLTIEFLIDLKFSLMDLESELDMIFISDEIEKDCQ